MPDHYCPVKLGSIGLKANIDAPFEAIESVSDLNWKQPFAVAFWVLTTRSRYVSRQDFVRAGHGLPAVEDRSPHRGPLRWRSPRADPQLCRAVSRDGVRAAY